MLSPYTFARIDGIRRENGKIRIILLKATLARLNEFLYSILHFAYQFI